MKNEIQKQAHDRNACCTLGDSICAGCDIDGILIYGYWRFGVTYYFILYKDGKPVQFTEAHGEGEAMMCAFEGMKRVDEVEYKAAQAEVGQ